MAARSARKRREQASGKSLGNMLKSAHLTVTDDGSHEMVVMEIDALKVDQTYQRRPNQRRIDKLAREWDMAKAGVVEVSRRESGEHFVIDGWHRVLAAFAAGEGEILAHIHVGLTVDQEAHLFREMNRTRLPIKSLEEFRAALVENDPMALEIDEIVRRFGGKIAEEQGDSSRGLIVAVKSLEKVYKNAGGYEGGGKEGLVRALSIIRDAFGSIHSEYAQADMIKGVSAFVEAYSDRGVNPMYNRAQLVKRIGQNGKDALMQQAQNFRAIYGGSLWVNVARSLIPIYNTGRAVQNRIPEWDAQR